MNLGHKVVVGPTPVSQITDLAVDSFIDEWPLHVNSLLFGQALLAGVEQTAEVVALIDGQLAIDELGLLLLEFLLKHEVFLNLIFKVSLLLVNVILTSRITRVVIKLIFVVNILQIWK